MTRSKSFLHIERGLGPKWKEKLHESSMLFLLLKAWNLNQWLCRWKTEFQIILQAWKKHEKSLSNYLYDLQLLFFLHFICMYVVVSLQEEGNCQAFPIFFKLQYNKIKSEAAINCALELLFFYLWQGSQVTVTKRLREFGITWKVKHN